MNCKYKYHAYGLNIISQVVLPALAAHQFAKADLIISYGAVDDYLDTDWHTNKVAFRNWQGMPGRFLFEIVNVGRFLAIDGAELIVEKNSASVDPDAISAYIMSSMIAVILQQRATSILHASAVEIDGKAALFCGHSGAGKSTLSFKMTTRGARLIADDIVALTDNNQDAICATPAFPTSRLWKDSMKRLSAKAETARPVRKELEKYLVPNKNFCGEPCPIKAAYILKQANTPSISVEPVPLHRRHEVLVKQGFRNRFLKAHKLFQPNFEMMLKLAKTIPVFEVMRSDNGFEIDSLAANISSHFSQINSSD